MRYFEFVHNLGMHSWDIPALVVAIPNAAFSTLAKSVSFFGGNTSNDNVGVS